MFQAKEQCLKPKNNVSGKFRLKNRLPETMKRPILLSWSGGKDSALALHRLRSSPDFEPAGLLTTINEDYDRISVHGVRRELLERQAASASPSARS